MINKQNLWFVTLFSLIIVLSIYYLTMSNDVLSITTSASKAVNKEVVQVEESEVLAALRVDSDEEVIKEMNTLQEILLKESSTVQEKNTAFESLKGLNKNKGQEQKLEKIIYDQLKLKTFIKITNDQIKVVVAEKKHDEKVANNIMRLIQQEYTEQMYITVKFQDE